MTKWTLPLIVLGLLLPDARLKAQEPPKSSGGASPAGQSGTPAEVAKAKKARAVEIFREGTSLKMKLDKASSEEEKESIRGKLEKLHQELSGLLKDLAGDDPKKQSALAEEILKEVSPEVFVKMQVARTKALLRNIRTALALYQLDLGSNPTSAQGLKALLACPDDDSKKYWRGPYLESKEGFKDAWGRDIVYRSPSPKNPSGYDLRSLGPDGVEGTADDVEP